MAEIKRGARRFPGIAFATAFRPKRIAQSNAAPIRPFHQPANPKKFTTAAFKDRPDAIATHRPELNIIFQFIPRPLGTPCAMQHEAKDAFIRLQADQIRQLLRRGRQ